MSSFHCIAGPSHQTPPVPCFNLESMLKKADDYSHGAQRLSIYIKNILNDPGFQKDPKTYLKTWEKHNINQNEIKFVENGARKFFYINFSIHRVFDDETDEIIVIRR